MWIFGTVSVAIAFKTYIINIVKVKINKEEQNDKKA